MQAQDLKIGDNETTALDHREHLRERGRVCAGENIFSDERVNRARRPPVTDGMEQRHAVVGKTVA